MLEDFMQDKAEILDEFRVKNKQGIPYTVANISGTEERGYAVAQSLVAMSCNSHRSGV